MSPSQARDITAHGGGATLQDCMGLWDAATHMSKQEWKAACMRSMVVEFPYGSRQPSGLYHLKYVVALRSEH
jgi:hypothetical protein